MTDSPSIVTPRMSGLLAKSVFSGLGRITQMVSADGTSAYTYDATSQLTAAAHDYRAHESYSYDANGNRTLSGYDTGDNNQLLSDGTYDYTYDDEGNRLTRTHISSGHVTAYDWDHRNRLISVTDYDDSENILQLVAYHYDLFNRRLSRALDTTSPFDLADAALERFVYDDLWSAHSASGLRPNPFHLDTSHSNVVLDFVDPDGSGASPSALRSRHLFGAAVDQLLAQEDVTESLSSPDRVLWLLTDHLQTTRDLIDNAGDLREHYQYDSFGQILSGDITLTRYLFTSREHDPATNLNYHRARHYDPTPGRWLSEDPIGFEAGDANIVRYVGNAVSGSVDPSGQQSRPRIRGHFEPGTPVIDPETGRVVGFWQPDGTVAPMERLPEVTHPENLVLVPLEPGERGPPPTAPDIGIYDPSRLPPDWTQPGVPYDAARDLLDRLTDLVKKQAFDAGKRRFLEEFEPEIRAAEAWIKEHPRAAAAGAAILLYGARHGLQNWLPATLDPKGVRLTLPRFEVPTPWTKRPVSIETQFEYDFQGDKLYNPSIQIELWR